MSDHYILEGHTAVKAPLMVWARWFEENTDARRVAQTTVAQGVRVSTVFLGLDHAWGDEPPMIFETMVFWDGNEEMDQHMDRYSTWEQAEAGHHAMVEEVRSKLPPPSKETQ